MSLSLPSQRFFTNSLAISKRHSTAAKLSLKSLSIPLISAGRVTITGSHFQVSYHSSKNSPNFKHHHFPLRAYDSSSVGSTSKLSNDNLDRFDFNSFLSLAELLCIVSSVVISVGFAVNYTVFGSKFVLSEIGKRFMVWGVVGLVGSVAIGAWMRSRQWRRICKESVNGEKLNLIERIEKLEEDLRSSASIIRVLSRQLEKLGIRFRITRKALKEPIAETAALAQKNSEATRALGMQEDILEKELGETQKVLLAMQDQQQKQLELILAIAKNSNLLENKQPPKHTVQAYKKKPSTNHGQAQENRQ